MKGARFFLPATAAAGILFFAVLSGAFPLFFSSTRSFSIDGRRYSLLPSRETDFSLVRRELSNAGIDLPPDTEEDPAPHPALSFALQPEGEDRSPQRFPVPPSFGIEHTLRLATDGGAVEIAFGTTRHSGRESARLLQARGWSCSDPGMPGRRGTVATYTIGKEKLLAFLEAEGGEFLLVRRMER